MRRLVFAALLLLLFLSPGIGQAEALSQQMRNVLEGLDFSQLDTLTESMLDGEVDARSLIEGLASGSQALDASGALARISEAFRRAFSSLLGLMMQILIPAVLCGVVAQMGDAFASDGIAGICRYACFLFVLIPVLSHLAQSAQTVGRAIRQMSDAMQVIFPMLLALLAAVGGSVSSAVLQPAVIAASGTMTTIVRDVTLKLLLCAGAVTAICHLSDRIHLSRLAGLLKDAANWTLGVCFTVFIGVMVVQGVGSAAVDGVSIRTAKYAIDNFVPVVGGMFADTVDTLVGCSLLIKNALGVFALILLCASVLGPLMQVLATVLIFKICAALLEPIADSQLVACIGDLGDVLMALFSALLCVSAMFFLLVTQVLVVGNMTVMLR